jgi:Mg-chelatase subunit ChlD
VVDGSRQFYRYFDSVGINLHTNGAFAFANARTGEVVVRTTPEDLAMVEQSLDLLNKTPSELQIDAKFVSVTSNDAKGLGFQWDLGNMPLTNGSIGAQAGSAPSYTGQPGGANPSGIFPGAGPVRTPASPKPANVPIIGDVPLIGGLFRHEATKAEVAREKSGGSVGSVGSDGSVGLEAWADRPSDAKPAVSHAAAAAQLAANDAWPRSVTNGPAGALSAGKWEMPLSGVDARESAGKIYLPGDEKEQGAIYRRWTEDNGDKVPAPQVMRIGGVVSSAPVTNSVVRVEATGGFSGRVVTTASEEKFKGELAAAGDYIAHGSHDAGITILSSNMIGGHFTSIATNGVATRRFASEPVAPLRGAPPVSASKPQSAPSAVPSAVALAKADAVSKVEARTKSEIRNPQSAIRHLEEPPKPKAAAEAPIPQSEVQTRDNAFSTFSLNVSDVSFKLASASLQNGKLPDTATVRSEEFINAFNYHDTEPAPGAPVGFVAERTRWPFDHNRDLLRFSVKTSSEGRQAGRPLNLVLVLDKSGSMERADRVAIIREALRVLASQLQAQDILSVVVFARTPRLFADGRHGNEAGKLADELEAITPEGGTNLEEAMRLAYETALRHYLANGENRVVLLTDGAANLGNVEPELFKKKAEAEREQGVALDCFGVGWEDYNDNLLEVLSRSGGGRYGFINTPQEAATEFAGQLAGALRVAASDVKVQVEFNSNRVISWRQIGYAKDQLKKEQFRDNTVKAAQLTVAESGNALYTVELNPAGNGPVGTVFVRYRAPGTSDYYEHAWEVPYTGAAPALDQAAPAMRLAGAAAAFSEWLAGSPYAGEVTLDGLQGCLRGVPELYGADTRPKQLETMIREARSIAGK